MFHNINILYNFNSYFWTKYPYHWVIHIFWSKQVREGFGYGLVRDSRVRSVPAVQSESIQYPSPKNESFNSNSVLSVFASAIYIIIIVMSPLILASLNWIWACDSSLEPLSLPYEHWTIYRPGQPNVDSTKNVFLIKIPQF